MKTITTLILFCISTLIFSQEFDHSTFGALLKKYVDKNGMINYKGFKSDLNFDQYITSLSKANPENFSREEKLAFYINAYNAFVIKNVTDLYPISSPMKVDKFFDKYNFNVAGEEMSLNQIEYDIVLKIEPVLSHFGLVCAAKSCPRLLQKAYSKENVYKLLKSNGKDFLNNPDKNKLDKKNKTLYLSEIFDWFRDYFVKRYGSLKETVIDFINNSDAKFLEENEINIKFKKYDWTLNEQ